MSKRNKGKTGDVPVKKEAQVEETTRAEAQFFLREVTASLTQYRLSFPPIEFIEGFEKLCPGFAKDLNQVYKQQMEADLKDAEAGRKALLRGQIIAASLIASGIVAIVVCVIIRPDVAGRVAWALATLTGGLSWIMLGGSKKNNETKNHS